jgi:hypothetical protein
VARRTVTTLTKVVRVFIKALCCAMVLFVVLAALGIWVQRYRGRSE